MKKLGRDEGRERKKRKRIQKRRIEWGGATFLGEPNLKPLTWINMIKILMANY